METDAVVKNERLELKSVIDLIGEKVDEEGVRRQMATVLPKGPWVCGGRCGLPVGKEGERVWIKMEDERFGLKHWDCYMRER